LRRDPDLCGSRDVWDPLLFIDDQILDDGQILGGALLYEVLRCVAIGPGIIHVHVDITAAPVLSVGNFEWL
jgi:hypothetical protein